MASRRESGLEGDDRGAILGVEDHGWSAKKQNFEQRQMVLTNAVAAHPNRFVHGPPKHHQLPDAVWINKPENELNVVVKSRGLCVYRSLAGSG